MGFKDCFGCPEVPDLGHSIIVPRDEEIVVGKMDSINGCRMGFFDEVSYFSFTVDEPQSLVLSACG